MSSLLARRRTTAAVEGPSDDEIFGGAEPADPAPDEAPAVNPSENAATPAEPDEFDIAAEVVTDAKVDVATPPDAADSGETATAPDGDNAPANPEEDAAKSREEAIIEEYRRRTGASAEEAQAWLAAARNRKAEQTPSEQRQDQDQEQGAVPRMQRPGTPVGGASAAIGGLIGGVGGAAVSGLKKSIAGAFGGANAVLRGTGVKATAGLTPDMVKERLFGKWHEDYEIGKRGMKRTTDDLIKTAAAYNQLIRTGAPGRELEKIAKSQGTDIQTLISDVTSGKFQDNDAKAAVDALRTDPHVQKAWSKFSDSVNAYGEHLGAVQHNLTQLATNNSDKINLEIENLALGDIVRKHDKIEKPFELPANPISGDGATADGKSPQKRLWEQFMEMSQNGLSFIQNLLDKVATFVAQKLGR